jgi:hypothetical protein
MSKRRSYVRRTPLGVASHVIVHDGLTEEQKIKVARLYRSTDSPMSVGMLAKRFGVGRNSILKAIREGDTCA